MIKCPNCGSTAQIKLDNIQPSRKGDWEWNETYKCGCGCTIERRVQVREEIVRSASGTMIHYEHHH